MRLCILVLLALVFGAGARAQSVEELKRQLLEREAEIRRLRERLDPAPEDDAEFHRALERTLVQQGALVLAPQTYELQPHVSYAHWDRARSPIRREYEGGLTVRAGLGWQSQVELRVPYRQVETASASATAVGDTDLVFSRQLARESAASPGLIGALAWTARTGRDGFDGGVPTGFGFNVLQAGLTAVRTRDPLVFFAGASYAAPLSRDIAGTKIEPGAVLGLRFGSALAASPHTSATVGLNLGFVRRARLDGDPVADSDTVLGTFQVGFATVLSRRMMLNLAGDFRVTGNLPDFRLSASLPIRF